MAGVAFAIATCALWALSFVSPIVLQEFSPYAVTIGRYAVFGVASLTILPFTFKHVRTLAAADWAKATWLAMVGHLFYYLFLATGIQLSDLPGPTVVIGLLPLTVPVFANLRRKEVAWNILTWPLLGIAAGLLLVNGYEYQRSAPREEWSRYGFGIASAFAALACWTWYGITNAAWLKSRPHVSATAWTLAQGITLLPMVLLALVLLPITELERAPGDATAAQWWKFGFVSLVVGLGSTWLATLCWSQASRLLPTTLAGQLIVCTTIAAVAYGSLYRQTLPSLSVTLGVLLIAAAVARGVRVLQRV